jgi:hypothetical protein
MIELAIFISDVHYFHNELIKLMNIIAAAKLTIKRITIIASLKRFSLFSISSYVLSKSGLSFLLFDKDHLLCLGERASC